MVSVWNAVFFTTNGVIGLVSNLFVIFVLSRSKEMMLQDSSKFILNQSTLDSVTSFILILTYSNIAVGYGVPVSYRDNNNLHEFLCKFWNSNYFQWAFIFASTINLVIVTVDRYIKICHSMWYKAHVGRKTIITLLVLPWVIAPVYQGGFFVFVNDVRGNKCRHHLWPSEAVGITVGVISFTVQFAIPILVMLFCYLSIFKTIQSRWKTMDKYSENDTSVTNVGTSQSENSISMTSVSETKTSHTNSQISIISGNQQNQNGSSNGNMVSEKPNPTKSATSSAAKEAQQARNRKSQKKIIRTLVIVSVAFFVCWGCNQVMFFLVNIHVLNFGKIYRTPFYYFQLILAYCNCWVNPFIYITQFRSFRLAICKCASK